MNRMCLRRLVVGVISMGALVGASCAPSESKVIQTRRMSADFVATARNSRVTQIRATLRSSFDDVELTGGDTLTAITTDPVTFVETERRLVADRGFFGVSYERDFPGNEKDTLIEITLDRTSTNNVTASDSNVTMPTPFMLHWVASPISLEPVPLDFSRSSLETRFVVWDPFDAPDFEVGDVLDFSITGSCIEPYFGIIDWEDGEDALELTDVLQDRQPPNGGQTCVIDVVMTLSRDGVVDSAFRNGTFVAEQIRVLTLLARP